MHGGVKRGNYFLLLCSIYKICALYFFAKSSFVFLRGFADHGFSVRQVFFIAEWCKHELWSCHLSTRLSCSHILFTIVSLNSKT